MHRTPREGPATRAKQETLHPAARGSNRSDLLAHYSTAVLWGPRVTQLRATLDCGEGFVYRSSLCILVRALAAPRLLKDIFNHETQGPHVAPSSNKKERMKGRI